ncbi:hypothetical protein [Vibrio renipiscarius]|uniref:hypothetical protein n=1 Tax=Vibrio renipiscarius TaxID=1461322 RepID=UPI001269D362|nr:hypothetical protein [Vibrio renipiscarius]
MKVLLKPKDWRRLKEVTNVFFTIHRDLFTQGQVDVQNLNKVWNVCTDQHTFYQSDIDDVEATENSEWYGSLSDIDKMLWEESVAKSVQMGNKYDKVKVAIGSSYSPFEAFNFLSAPLQIILENSRNDAYFLKAIFKCFRQDSKAIEKHIDNRWIKFVMGGGSTVQQVIETELESFGSGRFTREKKDYLRCFVLLDSDKEYSGAPLKQGTRNLVQFLSENQVPHHILEKREMENYIPAIAFDRVTENRLFVEAYLRLSPEQKDYFDLEKGFRDVNFNSLPEEFQTFFSSVNEQDRVVFRANDLKRFTGEGRDDFKSECPKLFQLECVDKASLLERTLHQQNPNELKDIIQKIREQL